MRPPVLFLLRTRLARHRAVILVTLAALVVRLVWNLHVHPPTAFHYSDMGGYLDRGSQMLDMPEMKGEWLTLYPYGTHTFIGALLWVFGRKNDTSVNVGFAVLGALAAGLTYATARRFSTRRWVSNVVGIVMVGYYPWISLGGYALSEIPFAFCLSAAAFYGLRLADEGRFGDAWKLGLFLGLGAVVRPQILVAVVFLALHVLLRRRAWHHLTVGRLARVAAPLVLILSLSAWRLHRQTGEWGLVSTNGPLNFVFGRCHNVGLGAVNGGFFGPPSLGSLLQWEKDAVREHRGRPFFTLDPVLGEQLKIKAHMWDAAPNYALAESCVKKSGYLTQLRFAVTHVVLLWGYNIVWPDQGDRKWHRTMEVACTSHNIAFLAPAAAALLLGFRRRRARSMLLGLHVWSVVLTSMLYFGDTRYRAPYDGLLIVLAMAMYAELGEVMGAFSARREALSAARARSSSPPR